MPGYRLCTGRVEPGARTACPSRPPGQNVWPQAKLSDEGFEDEQKFDNIYLLDAYVYGSFDVGETDLQLRLGRQVINWGESIFIQGVNQTNPIDVPAARRAGAELKEILMPVWMAVFQLGPAVRLARGVLPDQVGQHLGGRLRHLLHATSTLVAADPGSCRSITVVGGQSRQHRPGHDEPDRPAARLAAVAW